MFIPGKKYGEDADQQVSFPVQCSFWALTDASRQSGKMSENVLIGTAVSFFSLQYFKKFKQTRNVSVYYVIILKQPTGAET